MAGLTQGTRRASEYRVRVPKAQAGSPQHQHAPLAGPTLPQAPRPHLRETQEEVTEDWRLNVSCPLLCGCG